MGEGFGESEETGRALVAVERSRFMPAMSIESAVERYNAVTEFVSRVLRNEVDYGVIPGTDKRTLLKPGAEKLTTFFGLSTRFQLLERIEDWTGEQHNGEPFFYYLYRCQLFRGDVLIAEGDASCNSRETKYRWREAQRLCPACGQSAIIKGREEFGGGWLCLQPDTPVLYSDYVWRPIGEGSPATKFWRSTSILAASTYRVSSARLSLSRSGRAGSRPNESSPKTPTLLPPAGTGGSGTGRRTARIGCRQIGWKSVVRCEASA